jgi:hypothetical protein
MNDVASRRRWWWPRSLAGKLGVFVTVGALLLAVAWTAAYVATERRVKEALAFSDRYGLPRTMEELVGPPIPEGENAAVPLTEATAIATAEIAKSPDFQANSYGMDASMLVNPSRLLADERYEALVRAADERPMYRSLAADADYPTYDSYRLLMDRLRFASAEVAIGRWLGKNGRATEGVERLLRLQRLNRKWRDKEPTAWSAICSENIEDSVCNDLSDILFERPTLPASLYDAVETELAAGIDYAKSCLRGIQAEKLEVVAVCKEYGWQPGVRIFRPVENLDVLETLDYFHRSMEIARFSLAQRSKAQAQLNDAAAARNKDRLHQWLHPVSVKHLPALQNLHEDWRHPMVIARCCRIVNAMARRKDFNAPLDSLGLPPNCLIDLYDGKPLRTKQTLNVAKVYSVGLNLIDDGGDFKDWNDVGLGPWPKK